MLALAVEENFIRLSLASKSRRPVVILEEHPEPRVERPL